MAVDARALHASGIGRYLRELLARWLADPSVDALVLLGDPDALRDYVASCGVPRRAVVIVEHRGAAYSLAAQRSWRRVGAAHGAPSDVTFFPHWDAPLVRPPRAGVVTVHDLTQFRTGLGFGAGRRAVGAVALRRVTRVATRVLSVSHAAASDLVAAIPAAAAKVRVVPNGGGERFVGAPPAGQPVPASPFLLWVGNLKPHKNPAAALDVLARLRAGGLPTARLCVVGRAFRGYDLEAAARARGVGEALDVAGEVSDARLHALYACCGALLFPSLAEGFGLPVVEAMAAGAPVVASSVPAVREVVGDAAPVFDPRDVAGMTRRVGALLTDRALRCDAVARGRRRAADFSWDACARDTLAVLRDAAGAAA